MTLENQVVSLDLSKRLKELGFKQESLFYYINGILRLEEYTGEVEHLFWGNEHNNTKHTIYSAYTVAELGEMLPKNTSCFKEPVDNYQWVCTRNEPRVMLSFRADTEANARAKMLIYLKENNLI